MPHLHGGGRGYLLAGTSGDNLGSPGQLDNEGKTSSA